jgi:4-hydroxy-4-methyl-2-oxoglutarate aldolase
VSARRTLRAPPDAAVEWAAAYAPYAAATVYEGLRKALGRSLCLDPAIRCLLPGTRLCGPARTVQTHVGSLRPVVQLLEQARPGEVIVVEAGGTPRATGWGGSFSLYCVQRGIAGCVTNAAARDLAEIRTLAFPVWAVGVSVRGALFEQGDGALDVPVALGEVVIEPGDLVIADDDGVVIVPLADARRALPFVEAQHAEEQRREQELRAGVGLRDALGL